MPKIVTERLECTWKSFPNKEPGPGSERSGQVIGPSIPCEPREIRINLHFIKKDVNTPAAQQVNYPDNPNTATLFSAMVQTINTWILADLKRQSLPGYTTYLPDSKLRLVLKGLYFHYDTAAWNRVDYNNPDDASFYNQFGVNKEKELNVFILGKAPGGGSGPSPFFLNMMGTEHPDTTAPIGWGFAVLVAHEIGHCLGLWHTHEIVGGNDSISDTPPELASGWIPGNSTITGNNLMGNQIDRVSLSRGQLEVMHARLRTISSGLWNLKVAPPTPRSLANGYAHGFLAVEETGDLMRTYWTNTPGATPAARWNFQIIPADVPLVSGSVISTNVLDGGRAYAVNERNEIVRTDYSSQLSIVSLGGPGTTPGSLVTDSSATNLYGVDVNRQLFRISATGGAAAPISGPTFAAGSLVATNWSAVRIFAVAEDYRVFSVAGTGNAATAVAGVTAVPGSLVNAGSFGLFGVNENSQLIRVTAGLVGSVHSVVISGGLQLHGGSLVWKSASHELYGVTTTGLPVRLFAGGSFATQLLPPATTVVPGSLVDGLANGLFGVTTAGDLLQFMPSGTVPVQPIPRTGGAVIAGSLISDTADGGRVYGVNVAGQIVNSWKSGSQYNYGIVE